MEQNFIYARTDKASKSKLVKLAKTNKRSITKQLSAMIDAEYERTYAVRNVKTR